MFRRRPLARMAVRTTVVAGTAAAVAGSVARSQAGAASAAPAQSAPAPVEHTPAPAPPAPTAVDQLTQLAALKASGALTDAEFETQKAKILG